MSELGNPNDEGIGVIQILVNKKQRGRYNESQRDMKVFQRMSLLRVGVLFKKTPRGSFIPLHHHLPAQDHVHDQFFRRPNAL